MPVITPTIGGATRVGAATFAALVSIVVAVAHGVPVSFEDGLTAYRTGQFALATEIWTPIAEAGSVEAQYNLGLLFHQGKGTPADPVHAYAWYLRAAEGGYARAQYRVAEMLEDGDGPRQDLPRAHFWFGMARRAKYEDAKTRQRALAKQMTSSQIAMAELRMRQQKRRERGEPDAVSLD
jgi:hypothetical protein